VMRHKVELGLYLLAWLGLCGVVFVAPVKSQTGQFIISGNNFLKDGKPFQIVSGSMHYWRVHQAHWADRFHKLAACGLNTVTTYVPWNLHEPVPGKFNFTGRLDIVTFIKLAWQHGLLVIVRPPPYICAEFDFGGFPAWLLRDKDVVLRCSNPRYLSYVDRFLKFFLPLIAPLQYSKGGPVIAMQVENEYGSYGNDHTYLWHLHDLFRSSGIDAILFSSNGPGDEMLEGGAISGVLRTVNFGVGADVGSAFQTLRQYQPTGPLFVTELWDGWFDHWGESHHTVNPEAAAETVEQILSRGASVNLYMAHGGTNFGFTNGANGGGGSYQPTVTSYDYDAPINESGDATPKCKVLRKVIEKYVPTQNIPIPPAAPKMHWGQISLSAQAYLFNNSVLDAIRESLVHSPAVKSMEFFHQNFGFILYRTYFTGPFDEDLILQDLRDRALVFVDLKYVGLLERENSSRKVHISVSERRVYQLDILVENMGRINFGSYLWDPKGITHGVRLGGQFLFNWTIYTLPMDSLSGIPFHEVQPAASTSDHVNYSFDEDHPSSSPADAYSSGVVTFYRGQLVIPAGYQLRDTFIAFPGWTKGFCLVNGFNLGRYWSSRGPQQTLYAPGPLFVHGTNEFIVFELHQAPSVPKITITGIPNLG
jgi:beta-galactosidase